MTDHRRPDYNAVLPYLILKDAAGCVEFCRDVFGFEVIEDERDEAGHSRHAVLRLDDSTIEVSEASEEYPAFPAMLHVYIADVDQRYEAAIDAGCESLQAPTDMDYGERGCGVADRWGNRWWLASYLGTAAD